MPGIAAGYSVLPARRHVAAAKWSNQFATATQGIDFVGQLILKYPRGLIYFLPWVLLFLFVRFSFP
jgi:hypothetical protein